MSERLRLRPAYTSDELAKVYATPHDHSGWADHQVRVAMTAQFTHALTGRIVAGADLSCGDGAILKALDVGTCYLGDFAPGHQFTGPIEATVEQIPSVDMFVCTETLEHLDDPDLVLKKIRAKARRLVLSTPVGAFDDTNPEHYWAWDRGEVEDMLRAAAFDPAVFFELDFRACQGTYSYGVWWCR
jgi:hypothetical protein